jgi:hypothetical protein
MDPQAELRAERDALLKADLDIRRGEERVVRQRALIAELAIKGQDQREAERLLGLLSETLTGWEQHRALIVERIAYLERKSSSL